MSKSRFSLVVVAVAFVLLQFSCSKKALPVSGSAGLSEEQEQPFTESEPLGLDSGGLSEEPMGFADSGESSLSESGLMDEDKMAAEKPAEAPAEMKAADVTEGLLDIYFDFDRAALRKESKEALQQNARLLILNPTAKIQIEGHTDERGSNEYNLALGARRARAVKRFLEALGVESNRIKIISFGEEKPFCLERAESCYKINRRAHFQSQP